MKLRKLKKVNKIYKDPEVPPAYRVTVGVTTAEKKNPWSVEYLFLKSFKDLGEFSCHKSWPILRLAFQWYSHLWVIPGSVSNSNKYTGSLR